MLSLSPSTDPSLVRARRLLALRYADVLGLKNHDAVAVVVMAGKRRLIFGDVIVRVSPSFRLELHLDSDEGNATGLPSGAKVVLSAIDPTNGGVKSRRST